MLRFSKKSTRAVVASLLLSFPVAACDVGELPEAEMSELAPIGHRADKVELQKVELDVEPALLGRVVVDSEELIPVANAQVVVEFVTTGAEEVEPLELVADAEGYFEVGTVPAGVTELTTNVFIDGEFGGSETVPVVDGQPVKKIIGVLVVTAAVICIATTWASARKISGSDKLRHCVASCRTARWCGLGSAWTAAVLKETFDSLCAYGPQWLKDAVSAASGCGGWDSADMAANARGIWAAWRVWKSCENWCNDYY